MFATTGWMLLIMMHGKNIVLGVTGSIAIVQSLEITKELRKYGANVFVIMTKSATNFITPLTFKTISKNRVFTDMFDTKDFNIKHIDLANLADLILIAPATANIIGKIANGIADDLLTNVIMASKKPIVMAPAMNTNMWENPIVQNNVNKLKKLKYHIIDPEVGEMACGGEGKGILAGTGKIVVETLKILKATEVKIK